MKLLWLVVGLVAAAQSQPVALHEGEVAGGDLDLQVTPGHRPEDALTTTLRHLIRQGRQLQEGTGRQTAASLASSLGSLFRPAITAFIGAFNMNAATSVTNAVTALLGGRSLDVIPPEAFMTAPTGRDDRVPQPTRDPEELRRRPIRRRQRHPAL